MSADYRGATKGLWQGTWLAPSEKNVTLDLGFVSSDPKWAVDIT